jgi:hypothetical protein
VNATEVRAQNARRRRPEPETDAVDLPRIEPGVYQACYLSHHDFRVLGRGRAPTLKVAAEFQLIDRPAIVLTRWYRVKGRVGGRYHAGAHSDLVREVSAALNQRVRANRVPISSLKGLVLMVEVRDVERDHRQRDLAAVNRYSVIARIVGPA